MRVKYILFLLSCFCFPVVYGQSIISGKIITIDGEKLNGAIISVKDLDGKKVLSYGLSNDNGDYKLSVIHPDQNLFLEASFLGYTKQSIAIENKSGTYNFIMSASSEELKEVTIKSAPIYKINDTINYDIEEFTVGHDRVISDVLRKLPGIEVLSDGQIVYRGKPIKKFYINGLDLLEGKYRIANDNLPVDAVKSVQVIENDQPIKILRSHIFSDQASVNIKLKKFATTGSAKVGIGAQPLLRDINITPMTFHKSYQAIYSFQSNNTGNAINRTLRGFYDEVTFQNHNYLNIQSAQSPPFSEKRWLDNSINLGSINILKKLKNEIELKGSLSYYNDFQKMKGDVLSTVFTPHRDIRFTEVLNNQYSADNLRASITAVKNVESVYFSNRTNIEGAWNRNRGYLLKNSNSEIAQENESESFGVDNEFTGTAFWGKQLIHIGSNINYSNNPMFLRVLPGQFEDTLHEGSPYGQLIQNIGQSSFLMDNYLGFTKTSKRFTFTPRLGLFYQNQNLESSLTTVSADKKNNLSIGFQNNIRVINRRIYANLRTQYKFEDVKAELFFPLNFQSYKINDINNTGRERVYIEPNLNLIYEPLPFLSVVGNLLYANQIGGIDQLYRSYILSSYSRLQKYNGLIPESSTLSGAISFHYKNPLQSIFSNFGYTNSKTDRSFIYSTTVDDNGLSSIELIEFKNSNISHRANFDISKYVQSLKTTFKLGVNARFSEGDYIINKQASTLDAKDYGASLLVSYNQMDFLDIVYNGSISFYDSQVATIKMNDFTLQNHSVEVNIHPFENHIVSLDAEYVKSVSEKQDINQSFVDATYRFTLAKKKIDLELRCSNLLNTTDYTTFFNLSYSFLQNTYVLRPRQFLVSAAFRF